MINGIVIIGLILTGVPLILLNNTRKRVIITSTLTTISIISIIIIFYILYKKHKTIEKRLIQMINYLTRKRIIRRKEKYIKLVRKEMREFTEGIRYLVRGSKYYTFQLLIQNILFIILFVTTSAILIRGVSNTSLLRIYVTQFVILMLMYLSPTPGASGVAEGTYAAFCKTMVAKEYIPTIVILWRVLTIYVGCVIGVLILIHLLIRNGRGKRREQKTSMKKKDGMEKEDRM